MLGNVLVW